MTTKSFEAINKSTSIIEKNLKDLEYLKGAVEKHKLNETETKR
jgi:hypothetical protein